MMQLFFVYKKYRYKLPGGDCKQSFRLDFVSIAPKDCSTCFCKQKDELNEKLYNPYIFET